MSLLGVVHISDIHACEDTRYEVRRLRRAILQDMGVLQDSEGICPALVCISGDLIQDGSQGLTGERQLEIVHDEFIAPLAEGLGLTPQDIYIVPGNHEVDRFRAEEHVPGLRQELRTERKIGAFIDRRSSDSTKTIAQFCEYADILHPASQSANPLFRTHIHHAGDQQIGLACLNSTMLSMGESEADRGNLVIGARQLELALDDLEECDFRIAVVHHPLDWMKDASRYGDGLLFGRFDLVLSGHVHGASEEQVITHGQTTLYCTSAALSDPKARYGGYQVFGVNALSREVIAHFRRYYERSSGFDRNLDAADEGRVLFSLKPTNLGLQAGFQVVRGLLEPYASLISQDLISSMLDPAAPGDIQRIFVAPPVRLQSEYRKEETKDKLVSISEVMDDEDNIVLYGREGIGKTTLLRYIGLEYMRSFESRQKVPFVVDARALPSGKGTEPLEKAMASFVLEVSGNTVTPTGDEVRAMLKAGVCVILLDNVDDHNDKLVGRVHDFCSTYPGNRVLLAVREEIQQSIQVGNSPEIMEFKRLYIQSLSRAGIRELATKWFSGRSVDLDRLVDRVMYCISSVGLPRNPWTVSLILAVCSREVNYIPINEASVITRFVEFLLGRLSPDEAAYGTYDFVDKEDYLAYLASRMAEKGTDSLSPAEFGAVTEDYFRFNGLPREDSQFDEIFFRKGILAKVGGRVYFRFKCLLQYYVAKRAFLHPDFLDWLLAEERYLQFESELNYVTGLSRNLSKVIAILGSRLAAMIAETQALIPEGEGYSLDGIDFDFTKVEERLDDTRIGTEERDKLADFPDENTKFEAQRVERKATDSHGMERALVLFGQVIRNSELVEVTLKSDGIALCLAGYHVLLLRVQKDIKRLVTRESLADFLAKQGVDRPVGQVDADYVQTILRVTAPLVIQNVAAETMGTQKIHPRLRALLDSETDDFVKFMAAFLYADLKLPDYLRVLGQFIAHTRSHDLLKLTVMKLWFYYSTDYVQESQRSAVRSLIADAVLKLNGQGKREKSRVMKMIETTAASQGLLAVNGATSAGENR